jgi:hypothetical protein
MTALHEAVAESIVREGRDELMGLSPKERSDTVNQILNQVSQKSDDELISFISSRGSDVAPELKQKISEIQEVRQRIQSPEGGEMAFIESKLQKEAGTQKVGIVTRRDLPAGSIEIGFSDSPAKAIKRALSEHFGADVPVFSRGEDLLYLDPQTKEVVRAEPDFLQSIGFALPIAGDIAGTIGGGVLGATATKSPAGIVAGEAFGSGVGTGTGEYLRLLTGKFMGAHDLSNSDILKKAGILGVKASAATGTMGMLVVSAKGLSNFFKGGIFTKDEALKHGMNSKEAELVLEEVNKILGRKGAVKGTLGRLTDDVMVASKEAEVRRLGEHAQKFVERDLSDQKALTEALDVITQPSQAKGGQAIIDIASRQVGKRVTQAKGIVAENVTQLERKLSNIGKVSHELIGQPTRKIILAKSEAAEAAQSAVWSNLKKKHGFNEAAEIFNVKIPAGKNIKKMSAKLSRRADTASTLITKHGSSKIFAKGKTKPADLSDFNREISDLRSEIRAAYRGKQFGTPQTRDMKEALDSMVADRRLALVKAGKEGLLKDIEKAEIATAEFHKTFNRSVIGDLTKKTDDVFNIKSKDFVDKMLKSTDEEAKQLLNVIGDQPTLVALWKEGIADSYKRAAFKGNKFSRENSTKFLRKNADVLEQFFTKGELSSLEKVGSLAKKVAKQNDQLKKIVASANKFGRGKLKSLDPNNLVKFVTNNTGSFSTPAERGVQSAIAKINHVKSMTKNYPAAWKSFQDEFSTQLRKSAIDIKTKGIKPASLNKVINEQSDGIIEIMGKEYFNDLVKINKAVQILGKIETRLVKDEAKQGTIQVIRALVAPPLTRRGRALTAGNIFLSKEGHRIIADSLLEPSIIHKIAKLAEHKKLTREMAELAVSLGFIGEEE